MWTYYCVLLPLLVHQAMTDNSTDNKRHKRYLVFTPSTQWGVFATVAIPLDHEATVSVAWFFEANYYVVDNATWFDPLLGDIGTVGKSKEERSIPSIQNQLLTRKRLYIFIESMFEKHGYPGQPCLLRAICENALSHFLHNGVLGDVIHLTLTPSTSMSEVDLDDCYYEAEYLGLEEQCGDYMEECPSNPVELFSLNVEEFS